MRTKLSDSEIHAALQGRAGWSVAKYFDTSAFTAAPQFVIGSSSRDPVRGPGLQNADLMIGKIFPITEKVSLELRAEAFNVSNTPPLNDPNGTFGSAAFSDREIRF